MYKFEKRQLKVYLRTRLEQAIAKPYDRRKNLPSLLDIGLHVWEKKILAYTFAHTHKRSNT